VIQPQVTIDASGLICPLPVIELARRARDLPAGTVIAVLADDPAAAVDIPAWCRLRGHIFLGTDTETAAGPPAAGAEPPPRPAIRYRVQLVGDRS
jgi:tRNA 2-thiouridine synthesizing protein A